HLLALEQAGDKPEPLVHDVTLLPRHAPSCEGAKVSPMWPVYRVTYVSGRTKTLRKFCTVRSARSLGLECQMATQNRVLAPSNGRPPRNRSAFRATAGRQLVPYGRISANYDSLTPPHAWMI